MGSTTNILITLVTISFICVSFSWFLGINTIGGSVVYSIFDKDTVGTASPSFNSTLDGHITKTVSQGEAGDTSAWIGFIDGLKKVFAWIIDLFTLGFALFYMLLELGAPLFLCSLIGLPVAIGYYAGLVSVIRGYDV